MNSLSHNNIPDVLLWSVEKYMTKSDHENTYHVTPAIKVEQTKNNSYILIENFWSNIIKTYIIPICKKYNIIKFSNYFRLDNYYTSNDILKIIEELNNISFKYDSDFCIFLTTNKSLAEKKCQEVNIPNTISELEKEISQIEYKHKFILPKLKAKLKEIKKEIKK